MISLASGTIVNVVLPVFGLIGIGYLVARLGVLKRDADQAIADFVFTLALPILIFRTILTADFSGGSPWLLWAAYFICLAAMWTLATQLIRRLFGRDARAGLVAGVSGSYSNVLLIGIPLIFAAYGTEGAAAVSLLIAVHLPVLMAASAILIEAALVADGVTTEGGNPAGLARRIFRNMASNPIVIGLTLAILWRLTGLSMPAPATALVNRLADVASTLALFSMGMGLRQFGIAGNIVPSAVLAVLKLLLMPALVFVAAFHVFGLSPAWAKTLVLAAACPTGVNAFVLARRFRTGEALASNAITLTTAIAVVTVTLWLQFLEGY